MHTVSAFIDDHEISVIIWEHLKRRTCDNTDTDNAIDIELTHKITHRNTSTHDTEVTKMYTNKVYKKTQTMTTFNRVIGLVAGPRGGEPSKDHLSR